MKLPICNFDAKNAILCPQCESKLETGDLTQADIDAAFNLAKIAKDNRTIDGFSLSSCKQIDGNYVLYLDKKDILAVRQSRVLYRILQERFPGKIWLVEAKDTDKKFIEDLLFPTKVLSINSVWAPGGIKKTKAVISGRWTPKFPIDIEKVIQIVKNARNLDIEIEFEEEGR
ncbi:MAG: transcription elongation factor NusA [Nitrosopumilaceae archaeon]|nr:transcription elongation factor NusA [Nitrosopumilaceae archaeon]NIU00585.1 transcription elongation factor NusA [Nitrosopumilaceae archaeon]NIU86971.1 transcription elongation factor NusA [Nitrosopumilaceae archaeon]NIV66435.1 transcription elongation factor NusA [Nitrosopumilaceae archaeon]NIX61187.1 transcription elongation factor NusA [Nitrosopumilaceae archaeon]